MPLTETIAVEFVAAAHEQMLRCPGCYGAGQVRASGDFTACFCLVCEKVAAAIHRIDHGWTDNYVPLIDPTRHPKTYANYKVAFDAAVVPVREFAQRCPKCFGVRRVWAGAQTRPCLVCRRIHTALDAYLEAVDPRQHTPTLTPDATPAGSAQRLIAGREDKDESEGAV